MEFEGLEDSQSFSLVPPLRSANRHVSLSLSPHPLFLLLSTHVFPDFCWLDWMLLPSILHFHCLVSSFSSLRESERTIACKISNNQHKAFWSSLKPSGPLSWTTVSILLSASFSSSQRISGLAQCSYYQWTLYDTDM